MTDKSNVKLTRKRVPFRIFAAAMIFFAVLLVFAAPAAADTWDGSSTDTEWYDDGSATSYTISTAAELAGLAQLVNNGNTFSGITITLGDDIDLNGKEWTPIGSKSDKLFSGIFDGNTHSIRGLSISQSNYLYYGLFGCCENSRISNLTVDGYIIFNDSNINLYYYVGGIAGWISSNAEFESCVSNVNIIITKSIEKRCYVGGIAGYVSLKGTADFTSCKSNGKISVTVTNNGGSDIYIGGILGYAEAKSVRVSTSGNVGGGGTLHNYISGINLTSCSSTGNIDVANTDSFSHSSCYAGGIVGKINFINSVIFNDCSSSGDISAKTHYGDVSIGGIIGEIHMPDYLINSIDVVIDNNYDDIYTLIINNCYSNGSVNGVCTGTNNVNTGSSSIYSGGIAGNIEQSKCMNTITTKEYDISMCYSSGDIISKIGEGNVGATQYINNCVAGGIVASMTNTISDNVISNCYSTGNITADGSVCSVSVARVAGGILGGASGPITIENCYSASTVSAVGSTSTNEDTNNIDLTSAGGICGMVMLSTSDSITINNSYALNDEVSITNGKDIIIQGATINSLAGELAGTAFKIDTTNFQIITDNIVTGTDNKAWCNLKLLKDSTAQNIDSNIEKVHATEVSFTDNSVWDKYNDYPLPILKKSNVDGQTSDKIKSRLTITVSVDTNGGSGTITGYPATVIDGNKVTAPSDVTKTGYTFNGWNLNGKIWDFSESICSINGVEQTLKANWTANTYQVVFHANNGTNAVHSQKFTYDIEEALTANTFTNEGCKFLGWAESDDAAEAKYNDGDTVNNLANENDATVNLYAVWEELSGNTDANTGTGGSSGGSAAILISGGHSSSVGSATYSITFDANGGSGTMNQLSVENGKTASLTKNTFTREGYTFAGWALSANGELAYKDGEEIKPERSMTLYALWVEEIGEPIDTPIDTEHAGIPAWVFAIAGGVLILIILTAVFIARRK